VRRLRSGATPGAAGYKGASATGPLIAYHGAGRVAWSARDTVSLTRTGFAGNPVGFRAVKLIAEAAAAVPLVLQDAAQRYDVHPVLQLLAAPNPAQSRAELMEALYGQLLLSGDGYLEAVAGESGAPFELHVLRSDRMRVIPGTDGWPVGYEYAVGARKHRFDVTGAVSPVCHVKAFHPQDDHYGLSPMQAAAVALDVHNSASRWSKALLDNAARPSGAMIYKGSDGQGSLSEEQYRRLQDEMESHHQGARNAGRPMLLEGGLDWKPMGFSPSDMEFPRSQPGLLPAGGCAAGGQGCRQARRLAVGVYWRAAGAEAGCGSGGRFGGGAGCAMGAGGRLRFPDAGRKAADAGFACAACGWRECGWRECGAKRWVSGMDLKAIILAQALQPLLAV